MTRIPWRLPGRRSLLLATVVLALIVVTAAAAPAGAAPPDPTLNLTQLQADLASGPLDGYMVTTMEGTTPEHVDVTVLAVVDGFYWGKLIMFESTDPAITDNGGIAAGMSGSPIYVDDGSGTDKLVGAVSWGEDFSLNGAGLATPIEYMSDLQSNYGLGASPSGSTKSSSRTVPLSAPVRTAEGTVKKLLLAPTTKAAQSATPGTGEIVMHPLALAEIGGLPPASKQYKALAAKLQKAGLTVVSAGDSPSSSTFTTPALEAGSPCGVLFSNGFYWMGVLGTVTYIDGDEALLFGHPILGDEWGLDLGYGPIQGTLTGATVDAVWPSAASPYKLMTPEDNKGVTTQDRSAGVIADLGASESTFPVTTQATIEGTGRTVTDETDVSEWFATTYWPGMADFSGWPDPGAAGTVAAAGLYHALDADTAAGSATTTTTVVATDSTGTYTVTRDNLWDTDGSDYLPDLAASDVANIVSSLVVDPWGVRDVHIDSVDVDATFSTTRHAAGITDITVSRALHVGDNTVHVTYYRQGSADPQSLDATLTIPAGTSRQGVLEVMSAEDASYYSSDYMGYDGAVSGPESLADVVTDLDAIPTNDDLVLTYTPYSADSGDCCDENWAAESDVPTGLVFSGDIAKDTGIVVLHAPSRVGLGTPIMVMGYVPDATKDVKVDLYMRNTDAADPTTPTTTVTAHYAGGVATFMALLPPSSHSQVVTAEVPALNDNVLPGAASRTVRVKAAIALHLKRGGGRFYLTARLRPKNSHGKVAFQRAVNGRWRTIAKVAVSSSGVARARVKTGPHIRARAKFLGSSVNASSGWVYATR